MKQLIVLIGPNGVGKSTTARQLVEECDRVAYVDSDWCRVMNPFTFSKIKKETITENIYCLLRNYLLCNDINTVIFTYSWHGGRREIYESVIAKLRGNNIKFKENIRVLKCSEEENIKLMLKDGRDEERIRRGMKNTFSYYDNLSFLCLDTTNMTPLQTAHQIISLINSNLTR